MKFRSLKTAALLLLALSALPAWAEAEKKIFAHYMGCFPVASGATYYYRSLERNPDYDSKDMVSALGGHANDYLAPEGLRLNGVQSAELDIRRALRGGIDGFAVDAFAGGNQCKATIDSLFKAAEEKNLPFEITICMDPSCIAKHPADKPGDRVNAYAGAIKWLLDRHGKSPKLARRNGKVLIVGYASAGIHRENTKDQAAWINACGEAHRRLEKLVGQPLYIHFDMSSFGVNEANGKLLGKNFNAVGSFLLAETYQRGEKGLQSIRDLAKGVRASGAEWSQPLWHQYNNIAGSIWVGKGFSILRTCWMEAMRNKATLLQYVTWNDYGEDTTLAPGNSTNYTVLDVNAHYVKWWKAGKEVAPEKDTVHVCFRRYGDGAKVFPFRTRRYSSGILEVVTILKEPAIVELPNRKIRYEAPKGIFFKQFPLQTGKVEAVVKRGLFKQEVCRVEAPEQVTVKPWREDNCIVCFGSNFMDHWKADFGDAKPFLYSENGDADNDGLPNWFEAIYGKKYILRSASWTSMDPKADPNGDGITNLEHYRTQTNPLKKPAKYQAGYNWNMKHIEKRGVSFNPDKDDQEQETWYYLYKAGPVGRIPHDGDYTKDVSCGVNVPYAGWLCHFAPVKHPKYQWVYGWICRKKQKDGRVMLQFVPRKGAMQILGWKSPVNGKVDISGKLKLVPGVVNVFFEVSRNREKPLFRREVTKKDGVQEMALDLKDVEVRKGDFLYFLSDCHENTASVGIYDLNIQLKEMQK